MAVSPGRSTQNLLKQDLEVKYVGRLKDIPVTELLGLLAYENASKISKLADENMNFSECVDNEYEEIKYNTAIYDDEAEDFIFNETLENLVSVSRKIGNHEAAEDVRILRSARAVIYYTMKENE